jgi:hypothetical protein
LSRKKQGVIANLWRPVQVGTASWNMHDYAMVF